MTKESINEAEDGQLIRDMNLQNSESTQMTHFERRGDQRDGGLGEGQQDTTIENDIYTMTRPEKNSSTSMGYESLAPSSRTSWSNICLTIFDLHQMPSRFHLMPPNCPFLIFHIHLLDLVLKLLPKDFLGIFDINCIVH